MAPCTAKNSTLPPVRARSRAACLTSSRSAVVRPSGLREAVAEYAQVERDYRTRNGLSLLLELTPPSTRLTYLRQARNIMQICAAAEAGSPQRAPMKRNSVRRTLLNGISKLLRYHLGTAVRNEIFAGVNYAKEKDGREVFLTASELAALLEACRHEEDAEAYPYVRELRTIVRMALVTGADRTPVLDLKVKDVELVTDHQTHRMQGTVHVRDSKSDARPRTVAITHSMCQELRPLVLGKEPVERIFSLDRHQLRYWFDKARDKAGRSHARFKDLRHQFGIYSEKAGLEHSRIRNAMGHKDDATTLRYKLYEVVLDVDSAERIERAMGLSAAPEKRLVNAG